MIEPAGIEIEWASVDLPQPCRLSRTANRSWADETDRPQDVHAVSASQQRRACASGQKPCGPDTRRRMRTDPAAIAGRHEHMTTILEDGRSRLECRGRRPCVLQKIQREDICERTFLKRQGFGV